MTRRGGSIYKYIIKGIDEILFPSVCLSCGIERTLENNYICPFCLSRGFEEANPWQQSIASGEIPPEGVLFQDAMWNYNKGGRLQQLMYHLKYDHKSGLGKELGILLANCCKERPHITNFGNMNQVPTIVPVPLHPIKMRVRGFNQARAIAEGVSKSLQWPVIEEGMVRRVKHTATQTGFSFRSRLKNIENAFTIMDSSAIEDSYHIIVDDVFTTGTTVFELARLLQKKQSAGIGILTVAQA